MISANPDVYGLAGSPLTHTLSPVLHHIIFEQNNDNCVYLAFDVKKDKLKSFIDTIDMLNIKGFNVTMPHKQAIMEYLDYIDEDALAYGAVNTVAVKDGKLYGYCTDPDGFYMALQIGEVSPEGKNIVVIGAGGAASSVSLMLAKKGAKKITIINRTLSRAEELCANISKHVPSIEASAVQLDFNKIRDNLADCDILVNCTPLGMVHSPEYPDLNFLEGLQKDAVVCDVVYNAIDTDLLKKARHLGHKTISGFYMLVYQGIIASRIFYGKPITDETIELIENTIKDLL